MTYILMAILVLMFVWAMTPGIGKFWHDHDWQLAQMKVVPSVYWSNKETVYHVYHELPTDPVRDDPTDGCGLHRLYASPRTNDHGDRRNLHRNDVPNPSNCRAGTYCRHVCNSNPRLGEICIAQKSPYRSHLIVRSQPMRQSAQCAMKYLPAPILLTGISRESHGPSIPIEWYARIRRTWD